MGSNDSTVIRLAFGVKEYIEWGRIRIGEHFNMLSAQSLFAICFMES